MLEHISDTGNIALGIVVLFLLWSLVRLIYKAVRVDIRNRKQNTNLVKMIHKDLIHSIRSHIVEMDDLSVRVKEHPDINGLFNDELDKLKANIQPYVDALERYLSDYRNQKVSVCIKTFLDTSQFKNDYMNEELITIARSKATKRSRTSNHRAVVGKNTDFINLCYGQSTFFGKAGLKELSDAGLYQNDSPDWWKKYNSTLVAPIRYYDKDGINGNMNINFDIIGFLCIDCKADIKEWESGNSFELQLLAILADSLYTYIRKFYNCFEETHQSYNERS